jgi:hypothetical protein
MSKMNTSDKIALLAVILSFIALGLSWFTHYKNNELNKKSFNKNYRPYVTAASFSYLNDRQLLTPAMHVLIIKIFNAPAYISSKKLSFYTVDVNGHETLFFEHPEYKGEILYPIENTQYTINTDTNTISHEKAIAIQPSKLIRKVRIEYSWISDKTDTYIFESTWEYNIDKHDWDVLNQKAN